MSSPRSCPSPSKGLPHYHLREWKHQERSTLFTVEDMAHKNTTYIRESGTALLEKSYPARESLHNRFTPSVVRVSDSRPWSQKTIFGLLTISLVVCMGWPAVAYAPDFHVLQSGSEMVQWMQNCCRLKFPQLGTNPQKHPSILAKFVVSFPTCIFDRRYLHVQTTLDYMYTRTCFQLGHNYVDVYNAKVLQREGMLPPRAPL